MKAPSTFLPKKGNYQDLASFKKATVIYDLTFYFAKRFLLKGDRTIDQMVQAARSGKQNIAEGCAAAATSAETELKLINVARASMKELLVDYEDYLRVRNLQQWSFDDERTQKTREFCKKHESSEDFMHDIDQRSDEAIANITITLKWLVRESKGANDIKPGWLPDRYNSVFGIRSPKDGEWLQLQSLNVTPDILPCKMAILLGINGSSKGKVFIDDLQVFAE